MQAQSPTDAFISDLQGAGIYIVKRTTHLILRRIRRNPRVALEVGLFGQRRKKALRIDAYAEDRFEERLHTYNKGKFYNIEVYGEERLDDDTLNLRGQPGIFALVDMIDGTDLLERGLSNWCSAVVFFCPTAAKGSRILASFVGVPALRQTANQAIEIVQVYYASCIDKKAFVSEGNLSRPVEGCSRVENLIKASICSYGQKPKSLQAITECQLLDHLSQIEKNQKTQRAKGKVILEDEEITTRIYTLAGIPMMVKLVDHKVKNANNIDAIFDIRGQKPHDVVAGAYIAKKGGAVLKKLDGSVIEFEDLEEYLMEPSKSELTYIIAATDSLCEQLLPLIQTPSKAAAP